VFVRGLPKEWSREEVVRRFSIVGGLKDVHLVKDSIGKNSGKAVVTYGDKTAALDAVEKFDQKIVDQLIVKVTPFFGEGSDMERRRLEPALMARRVYLMNVPYDASIRELEQFVSKFAKGGLDKIVVPRNEAGLARGYAFAYLNDARDVDNVIEYVDGRHIRNRQIR